MKNSKKNKIWSRFAMLGLIAASLGATVIANAQVPTGGYGGGLDTDDYNASQQSTPGLDAFSIWCDQVTMELSQAQAIGWNLYRRQMFTQARVTIMQALQRALNSMNIPGSNYRPATYREIQRTIALINALDAISPKQQPGNTGLLKAKTIAYVALQRISFIAWVKDAVDVYSNPNPRVCTMYNNQFETALASLASEQLSRAQGYGSIVGSDGLVYPLNDTPFYFTIIAKAAKWAAEDLSLNLYANRFSCAIINLRTLGSRAASYQYMFGDVSAVQQIHAIVDDLVGGMSYHPYGCGYRW